MSIQNNNRGLSFKVAIFICFLNFEWHSHNEVVYIGSLVFDPLLEEIALQAI